MTTPSSEGAPIQYEAEDDHSPEAELVRKIFSALFNNDPYRFNYQHSVPREVLNLRFNCAVREVNLYKQTHASPK